MVIGAINNYNYNTINPYYAQRALNPQTVSAAPQSVFSVSKIVPTPPTENTTDCQNTSQNVSFGSDKIQNPDQNKKYKELQNFADPQTKKRLQNLLKTGRLLNSNSNDSSTTLDNLHKIASTPRYTGLDSRVILSETVKEIENPFLITQRFGDIPPQFSSQIVEYEKKLKSNNQETQGFTLNSQDYNVEYSSTCPAASMQFNLADKKPAEYARIAAGLTSAEGEFVKRVPYGNISPSMLESLELLKDFNVKVKKPADSWNHIDVIVKPDNNAMIRAQIQNNYKDPNERSSIGVLMQSAFMNLASQDSYNSLTDKRFGKFSINNDGLTEFEKNFLESIMDDEPKISIVYQNIDENQKLQGYNFDFKSTEDHLLQSISSGSNIIIGIIEFDENNTVIGGHEMTVIGAKKDFKGNTSFICNDTDDDYSGPIVISAKDLVPKIHHAGVPAKLVELPAQEQIGYQILSEYNSYKAQPMAAPAGQKLNLTA